MALEVRQKVRLLHVQSRSLVDALLVSPMTDAHVVDHHAKWKPALDAILSKNPEARVESDHWDWGEKLGYFSGLPACSSFAVECDGEAQGLMILRLHERCRLEKSKGGELVYVEFLEVAPWNQSSLESSPRFRGVGSILVAAAVQSSVEAGFEGRIGLHSLPGAERWYREKLGMQDLGIDVSHEHLRYFEFTSEQAKRYIRG